MKRLAAIGLLALLPLAAACGGGTDRSDLDGLDTPQLEAEKLRAEIRQLEREGDRDLLDWAPIFTVMVAVVGTFVAIWRQIGERRADREQRTTEASRRLDERFAAATEQLGAESPAVQVGAAVALRSFLRPENDPYHDQVLSVVLANAKLEHDPAVRDEVVKTLELAIRRVVSGLEPEERLSLDLARARLPRIDLSGLALADEADLGFVDLSHADLSDTELPRARGYKAKLDGAVFSRARMRVARFDKASGDRVYFHDAELHDAHFKGATLRNAQFHRAKLQAAHFDGADLRGSRFEQADLNDTYFTKATLDDGTLRTITRADNWQRAHFDEAHATRLAELAGR